MWHNDQWMKEHVPDTEEFDYSNIDLLETYKGSHPAVVQKRIAEANWRFVYDPKKMKTNVKYQFLFWVEKFTGWRVGENRNYKLLK